MDFLNPISLLFLITLSNVNLNNMDQSLADDLSGHYVRPIVSESISAQTCPSSLAIELTYTGNSEIFFLKKTTHFAGITEAKPRVLPVDGKPRLLFSGELIKAKVIDESAIQVELYNQIIPSESLIETFTFEVDGTLVYQAKHKDEGRENPSRTLCEEAIYKRK